MKRNFNNMRYVFLWLVIQSFFNNITAQTADWTAYKPALFPTNASGQIHGISRVSQLKFHPTSSLKLYAVSARGGLFISANGGTSWTVAPGCDNLPLGTRFASVCVDFTNDQVIYLGGGDHNYYSSGTGVWKSTDGGNTFAQTSLNNRIIVEMIMDPANHNVIVAATSGGIYKTTDGGATWTLKGSAIALDDLKKKESASSRVLFTSTRNAELYQSSDFGDTWTQITSGIYIPSGYSVGGGTRIGLTPADSNRVYFYMNAKGGTLFKSTDGGNTFTNVKDNLSPFLTGYTNSSSDAGQGDYNTGIGIDRTNANIVYFVAHNVWKSTDGGSTWTQMTNWWAKVHTDMHQIVINPYNNSQLWDMNDGGVWLSTDGGANWSPKSDGIYGYEIYHGSCSPTRRDMMSIGTQDNGELYATSSGWFTNRGGDWQSHCVFDYRVNSSMVYYFQPDWGTVWAPKRRLVNGSDASYGLPSGVTDFNDIAYYRGNPDLGFIGSTELFRTTNLTSSTPTWTSILNPGVKIMRIHVNFADANRLYVITSDQKMWISTNALSATPTFSSVNLPNATSSNASITNIKSLPNVIYITCNTKVYRSANNGSTWTDITYNLPGYNHVRIIADEFFSTSETVLLATGGSVYYKTAGAVSWSIYSNSLPARTSIVDMSIYNDSTANTLLRVFTYGRGVWETPINNLRTITANFAADNTNPCAGQTVNFSDLSTGGVISRSWSFPGGTPSTSTAANPSVVYNSAGSYSVTLTVSDGTTNSSATRTNYINLTGTQLPIAEGFEGATFPPANWNNVDAGNDAITWLVKNGVGGFGTSGNCMFFDNYNQNANGARDEFKSINIDLNPYSTATLKFDVAYQPYSLSSYLDSLQVLVSTNCGVTFTSVYLKYGATLGTVTGTNANLFTPTGGQWRTETIGLNSYIGQTAIIAFRNIGRYGNDLYIDNIGLNATVTANAGTDKSICQGASTNIGSAAASGLTYSWTPSAGLSSSAISNPAASPSVTTTYILTASYLPSGIYGRDTVVVSVNNLSVSGVVTNPGCSGPQTGSVDITPAGGSGNYAYHWSNNATTQDLSGVAMGTYNVTVTDLQSNCTATAVFTIQSTSSLSLSLLKTDVSCNGTSTGSIAATATGSGPFNYTLNGGVPQTSGNFSNLSAAVYVVGVTDNTGCSANSSITVNQPAILTTSVTTTPASSPAISNGTATASPGGGTTPYFYSWNIIPVQSTATATGLGAGDYTVNVYDQNNCSVSASGNVIALACNFSISATGNEVSCAGLSNGSITVNSSGATGIITYTLSPGGTSNTTGLFTGLAVGNYTINAVDGILCASGTTASIGTPVVLTASASSTSIICNGGTATITVSAAGGTPPYSGTGNFTVTAGNYNYTVTDAHGCQAPTSITVTQPAPFAATISASGVLSFCAGGSVNLSSSSGNSYLWNNGSTMQSILVTTAGMYRVTVSDINGCTAASNPEGVTVTPYVNAGVTISSNAPALIQSTTAITFTAAISGGGTSPVYQWKKNSANVGTNSAVYINNAWTNGDIVTCELTSNAVCVNGSPASSNAITIPVTTLLNKYLVADITQNKGFFYDSSFTFIQSGNFSTAQLNGITNVSDVLSTSGYVYLLDQTNKCVYRSAAMGTPSVQSKILKSNSGAALGTPTGLAISGDSLWILDKKGKLVYRYSLSAAFTGAGNLNAALKISLNSKNSVGESLMASGAYLYVLDNGTSAKTFYRYPKTGGTAVVSKAMKNTTGAALSAVTGAVIESNTVTVVDNGLDKALSYSLSALFSGTGTLNASGVFALNSANANATGITLIQPSFPANAELNKMDSEPDRSEPENPIAAVQKDISFKVYPNPTYGEINVELEGGAEGTYMVNIVDATGRLVSAQSMEVNGIGVTRHSFDLTDMVKGLYMVVLDNGEVRKTLRIVLE